MLPQSVPHFRYIAEADVLVGGGLYGLPVYVYESLAADEEIVFNAGTHHDAIRIRYADFARLAKPVVGAFASKG